MHVRHTNRVRGNLHSKRVNRDAPRDIDSLEVPTVKIGRFVQFKPGDEYSQYIDELPMQGDNKKGIKKGWFSIVEGPVFVEYADLTESLGDVLRTRVRPRSFQREIVKIVDSVADSVRSAATSHEEHTVGVNNRRREAIAIALETGDHAELIDENPWMYDDTVSRWGTSMFRLMRQPKLIAETDADKSTYIYGLPIMQDMEDQMIRADLVQIVKDNRLSVPDRLSSGRKPVVPLLELHRELSGMRGSEPTLPPAPYVHLGPVEVHRF